MQDTDTRSDIRSRQINGLRLLADTLAEYPGLPVPHISLIADDEETVQAAAAIQRAEVHYHAGHTSSDLFFDGLGVRVFHIDADARADYQARSSYSTVVQP